MFFMGSTNDKIIHIPAYEVTVEQIESGSIWYNYNTENSSLLLKIMNMEAVDNLDYTCRSTDWKLYPDDPNVTILVKNDQELSWVVPMTEEELKEFYGDDYPFNYDGYEVITANSGTVWEEQEDGTLKFLGTEQDFIDNKNREDK